MFKKYLAAKQLNNDDDPKDIQSNIMQNSHELEATYRVKGKKSHVGYTTNIVEPRDREKGLSVIVHYENQPNIISDAEFGLNSRPPDQDILPSSLFRVEPETELITACLYGAVPVTAEKKDDFYAANFDKKDCSTCPNLERCIVKEQKRYFMVRITEKQYIADTCRSLLGTEHHRALGDFLAGVEDVPIVFSVLSVTSG